VEVRPDEAGSMLLFKVLYAKQELQTVVNRGVYVANSVPLSRCADSYSGSGFPVEPN